MRFVNLLFDADDTLFDFSKASAAAFHAVCASCRLPETPQSRAYYDSVSNALWRAFDRGEVTQEYLARERFVQLLQWLGLRRDPDECGRVYVEALGRGVYPQPHAEEVCRTLAASHRLYLITNAFASVQRSRLSGSVFAPLITDTFISEEIGTAKPARGYFERVLSLIGGADCGNTLVIGDSLTTDIRGANNAGLPCCWYNPGGLPRPGELRIDWVIRDLRELYDIVT